MFPKMCSLIQKQFVSIMTSNPLEVCDPTRCLYFLIFFLFCFVWDISGMQPFGSGYVAPSQ